MEVKVNIEGTLEFDPAEQDLEGRIDEMIRDVYEDESGEEDDIYQRVRWECIGIIIDELIGHTDLEINWHEEA